MRFTRALVPLALASALLAGCGTGSDDDGGTPADTSTSAAPTDNGVAALEPAAIVDKATATLDAAKSFSVKGEITGELNLGLDVKIAGDDVQGTLTLDGATVELLRVAGQMYVRPDEKFWAKNGGGASAGAAIAELLGDRWALVSSKDAVDFRLFFQLTDPKELLKPDGALSKGDTKTIDGVNAVGVIEAGDDGGTMYVATTGEPYPLLLEAPAGQGQIAFGDFGSTFDIKAPAADKTIDMDKLTQK